MASYTALYDAAIRALLHSVKTAGRAVDAFLAASAKQPFGGLHGERETFEIYVLQFTMPQARKQTGALARRTWLKIATSWADSVKAGRQSWYTLARCHRETGVRVPAKLRPAIRRAWARGRLWNTKGERAFAAYEKAKQPEQQLAALIAIAAKAGAKFEFWEELCAALVLLDDPDPKLAARWLAKWKSGDGAETSIYELR